MKHLKLFENYDAEQMHGTLRDVVNPDNFDWEGAQEQYEETKEAALWTAKHLGLALDPASRRLLELGLTDLAGLLGRMPLSEIALVFDTLAVSWHDAPRFRALAKRFPGLIRLDDEGNLVPVGSAIAQQSFGEISAEVFLDRSSGVLAVWWYGEHTDCLFMLASDLSTGHATSFPQQ
jgi:hypothetical protein